MYQIDNNTGAVQNFIPGINENVFLTAIAYEPQKGDGSGQLVLRFKFKDSTGKAFNHTEFPIDEVQTRQAARSFNADPDKFLMDQIAALGERLKHIISCYVDMQDVVIRGNDFGELVQNYIAMFPQGYQQVPLRALVSYNKKGYLCFPSRAITPFLERMDRPNGIVINPKYHILTPPVKANANTAPVPAAASAGAYVPPAPSAPQPVAPQPVAPQPQQVVEPVQPVEQPIAQPQAVVTHPQANPLPVAEPSPEIQVSPVAPGAPVAPSAPQPVQPAGNVDPSTLPDKVEIPSPNPEANPAALHGDPNANKSGLTF